MVRHLSTKYIDLIYAKCHAVPYAGTVPVVNFNLVHNVTHLPLHNILQCGNILIAEVQKLRLSC